MCRNFWLINGVSQHIRCKVFIDEKTRTNIYKFTKKCVSPLIVHSGVQITNEIIYTWKDEMCVKESIPLVRDFIVQQHFVIFWLPLSSCISLYLSPSYSIPSFLSRNKHKLEVQLDIKLSSFLLISVFIWIYVHSVKEGMSLKKGFKKNFSYGKGELNLAIWWNFHVNSKV